MPSDELTVIAVTSRFVIAVDESGRRERVETPGRAGVEKGATLTREALWALAHPEPEAPAS